MVKLLVKRCLKVQAVWTFARSIPSLDNDHPPMAGNQKPLVLSDFGPFEGRKNHWISDRKVCFICVGIGAVFSLLGDFPGFLVLPVP